MKRLIVLSTAALLGVATSAWGWGFVWCPKLHYLEGPPPCVDCKCPCDGPHHCSARKSENARQFVEALCSGCGCDRVKAARALGCRIHDDFCCDPEVLTALVHALQCDPMWEVRRAAADSIRKQHARTDLGVLSLYLASKLDPHYMVRDTAADSLDILLAGGRQVCFKDLFTAADGLVKALGPVYKPGVDGSCVNLIQAFCGAHGIAMEAAPGSAGPAPTTLPATPAPAKEKIPAPLPATPAPEKVPAPVPSKTSAFPSMPSGTSAQSVPMAPTSPVPVASPLPVGPAVPGAYQPVGPAVPGIYQPGTPVMENESAPVPERRKIFNIFSGSKE